MWRQTHPYWLYIIPAVWINCTPSWNTPKINFPEKMRIARIVNASYTKYIYVRIYIYCTTIIHGFEGGKYPRWTGVLNYNCCVRVVHHTFWDTVEQFSELRLSAAVHPSKQFTNIHDSHKHTKKTRSAINIVKTRQWTVQCHTKKKKKKCSVSKLLILYCSVVLDWTVLYVVLLLYCCCTTENKTKSTRTSVQTQNYQ